jgi:uncharacterized membrane protein (DUF2068 family)
LASRFKIKRLDALLIAVFYLVVGAAEVAVLAISNFGLVTAGALAILSFIAAYGLLRVRKWAVWFVIALFFPQVVFGASTLYGSTMAYLLYQETAFILLDALMIIFIFLSLISFVYMAAKRKTFE